MLPTPATGKETGIAGHLACSFEHLTTVELTGRCAHGSPLPRPPPARPTFYTFRLCGPLPVPVQFPSICYFLEIYAQPYVNDALKLIVREPGQNGEDARELRLSASVPDLRADYARPFDVEPATLAETVLLRLVRDGSAEIVAGLHCRVPQRLPPWIDDESTPP